MNITDETLKKYEDLNLGFHWETREGNYNETFTARNQLLKDEVRDVYAGLKQAVEDANLEKFNELAETFRSYYPDSPNVESLIEKIFDEPYTSSPMSLPLDKRFQDCPC